MKQVHSDHAHTLWFRKDNLMVILHWPVPAGCWSWAGSCSWSSLDAPTAGCGHAWDHFGCLYFTLLWLTGTRVGVPRSRKPHVSDKAHSLESVSDTNCSHRCSEVCEQHPVAERGVSNGCGWVPARTCECTGLRSSSGVIIRLEHPDENIYTVNAQWCFLAQEHVKAEDGRWFADGRHCGDRLGLLPASLRTCSTFAPDSLGPSCFLIAFCYLLLPFPFLPDFKAVACCVIC